MAVNDLAPVMGLLGQPRDVVLVQTVPKPSELPSCLQHLDFVDRIDASERKVNVVPFGWSDSVRQTASGLSIQEDAYPDIDAVRDVNGREFNATYDVVETQDPSRLPFGSAFGRLCRDRGQWESAANAISQAGIERSVTKAAISHAGRNRLLTDGTELNEQQQSWLAKQLRESGYVYVEPWVTPHIEWGLQFDIDRLNDEVQFIGATKLINDSVGRYLGSLFTNSDSTVSPPISAVQHGANVCRAAYARRYYGPLGIDCFQFSLLNGRMALRLCNDINARFTMGRIALQFAKQLNPDEFAFWGQFRASDFFRNTASSNISSGLIGIDDVRVTVTSPRTIQDRPVRTVTALLVGTSETSIHQVRKTLMATR